MPVTDQMPTAAKLVAAICLGTLGWVASDIFKPLMPPQTDFGYFSLVNLGLGVVCGWVVVGTRVGRGYFGSLSAGFTGMAAMVFWAVVVQSFNEMLRLALDRRYDGPFEAITEIFNISFDFGQYMLDAKLIGTLIVGGMITGIAAEWAWRRWT